MHEPKPHRYCAAEIMEHALSQGVEVTVTVRMPAQYSSYQRTVVCEHGITYWVHPSDGQIEEWKRIGMNP